MSCKKSADLLLKIRDMVTNSNSFNRVLEHVSFTALHDGKLTAEFKVLPEHLNEYGGLHGGFMATVVDNLTTFALLSKNKTPAVSVDLHVSYLQGANLGDEVLVDATTVRAGRRLAYLECELKQKTTGSLIARGSQTVYFLGSE